MFDDRVFDQLGQFSEFDSDFKRAKTELVHIYLNIYLNSAGTVFANDSIGNPIQNRLVYFTTYTLPHVDPSPNETMYGFLKIGFNDGSEIKCYNDEETKYWYSINGLSPFVIKQLT